MAQDHGTDACRVIQDYLATLDDTAVGAASESTPKFVSLSDPVAHWTGAHKEHVFFAHATNYLIDTQHWLVRRRMAEACMRPKATDSGGTSNTTSRTPRQ